MLRTRLPYLGALAAGLLFLWQALQLDTESPFGPGPGVFPRIACWLAVALAALLLVWPGSAHDAAAEEEEEPTAPEELRTFRLYILGLVLMVVGAAWLGFAVTALLLALLLTWFAERRPWHHAVLFGVVCGIVGTIGLGHFLEIEMPYAFVDSWLRSLVR